MIARVNGGGEQELVEDSWLDLMGFIVDSREVYRWFA